MCQRYLVTACYKERLDSSVSVPISIIVEHKNEDSAWKEAKDHWTEKGLRDEAISKYGKESSISNFYNIRVQLLSEIEII